MSTESRRLNFDIVNLKRRVIKEIYSRIMDGLRFYNIKLTAKQRMALFNVSIRTIWRWEEELRLAHDELLNDINAKETQNFLEEELKDEKDTDLPSIDINSLEKQGLEGFGGAHHYLMGVKSEKNLEKPEQGTITNKMPLINLKPLANLVFKLNLADLAIKPIEVAPLFDYMSKESLLKSKSKTKLFGGHK